MKQPLLEICVDSAASALIAANNGADRLELCANLIIGGTTPSVALFKYIRNLNPIKAHILIRPRFGDFCYTDDEVEIMKQEILQFKALGAEGIVIGVLTKEGYLDKEKMKILLDAATGMSVTLHRAFDVTVDPYQTLEDAIELRIDTILTSGQHSSALNGKEVLKKLVQQANGRIDILVGAGVNDKVIEELHSATGAISFHMSGKIEKESKMIYRKTGVPMGLDYLSEFIIWESSPEKIQAARSVMDKLCCD
jgi:copper homeostasis protein